MMKDRIGSIPSSDYGFSAEKWQEVSDRLAELTGGIRYGEIGATFRIHNNQIVSVTYSRTEQTRRETAKI